MNSIIKKQDIVTNGTLANSPKDWRRRYPEPQNIVGFYGPDSDEHAYWLGFLAADGCVYTKDAKRNHSLVRLKLQAKDKDHLEALRQWIGTEVRVKETIDGPRHVAYIEFNSPQLVQALSFWGITQKKSLNLAFPNLPSQYIAPFIRGYFDGDGTIFWLKRKYRPEPICRFISGSRSFLERLREILEANDISFLGIYRKHKSEAFSLNLSNAMANLQRFARNIYPLDCIALNRKRIELERCFNGEI